MMLLVRFASSATDVFEIQDLSVETEKEASKVERKLSGVLGRSEQSEGMIYCQMLPKK